MGGDLYFRELKMGTVHSSTGFRQDPEGAQRACEGLWPGSLSKSYYFYRFKKYHIWILSFTQLFLIGIYDGACFLKNNILNGPNPSFATANFILFFRIRRFSYITSYIFAQASALVYIKFQKTASLIDLSNTPAFSACYNSDVVKSRCGSAAIRRATPCLTTFERLLLAFVFTFLL